jgi:hypothetical protein
LIRSLFPLTRSQNLLVQVKSKSTSSNQVGLDINLCKPCSSKSDHESSKGLLKYNEIDETLSKPTETGSVRVSTPSCESAGSQSLSPLYFENEDDPDWPSEVGPGIQSDKISEEGSFHINSTHFQ